MSSNTHSDKTKRRRNNSQNSQNKQPKSRELRQWYAGNNSYFADRSDDVLQITNPLKNSTKTFNTFSKESLRTYMKNPLQNASRLLALSRFLYYRSQIYRRIIAYNANMIDLNMKSVIPIVDIINDVDSEEIKKSFYDTSIILENMNLPLEFYKVYTICWREDVFFGCAYYDKEGFFILPLDPDYCKITGIYYTGDLSFDMDMTYFSQKQELLEFWGEPFQSMWKDYQKDTVNNRWQPMPDENCVCLKVNIDDISSVLPPYMALFDSLINLEDLKDIQAIADEQQIYKLLVATIPSARGTNKVDDFIVDPDTAINYFNRMVEALPSYTNAVISPIPIDSINFNNDAASDTDKVEKSTKSVLLSSGGIQTLYAGDNSTGMKAAIRSDEEYALSSLLPQTEAWINRFLRTQIKNPSKVKFIEVTRYTKQDFKEQLIKDSQYGVPVHMELNALNGYSQLQTISMAYLEDALEVHTLFKPLVSSNTLSGNDIINGTSTTRRRGRRRRSDGGGTQEDIE